MTPKQRLFDYLIFTMLIWCLFLIWLIPFQLYIVGLDWIQFTHWITYGTIADMIVSYPVSKLIIKLAPRISAWVVKQ